MILKKLKNQVTIHQHDHIIRDDMRDKELGHRDTRSHFKASKQDQYAKSKGHEVV